MFRVYIGKLFNKEKSITKFISKYNLLHLHRSLLTEVSNFKACIPTLIVYEPIHLQTLK